MVVRKKNSMTCKVRVHIASLEQYKTWNSPYLVKVKL